MLAEGDLSEATVLFFAGSLGIDVDKEKELLRIARKALTNLPEEWELGIGEGDYAMFPFFHNVVTDESIWTHPEEILVRRALDDKRKRIEEKSKKDNKSQSKNSSVPESLPVKKSPEKRSKTNRIPEEDQRKNERISRRDEVEEVEIVDVEFEPPSEDVIAPVSSSPSLDASIVRQNSDQGAAVQRRPFSPKRVDVEADKEQSKPHRVPLRGNEVPEIDTEENEFDLFRRGANDDETAAKSVKNLTKLFQKETLKVTSVPRAATEEVQMERPLRTVQSKQRTQRADVEPSINAISSPVVSSERFQVISRNRDDDDNAVSQAAPASSQQEQKRWGQQDIPNTQPQATYAANPINSFEVDSLRSRLMSVESELADERSARRRLDVMLADQSTSYEKKLREAKDTAEETLREESRRLRASLEEDGKSRAKTVERKFAEEVNDLSGALADERKKTEELRIDLESCRRKLSRESGRQEHQDEMERVVKEKVELDDEVRALAKELKKLREDYVSTSSKLASSLQLSSVAQAEMEALRITASTSSAEAATCHSALVSATQRMQQLDGEITSLRTSNYIIKQENETLQSELRKLRFMATSTEDKSQIVESDIKRKNTQLQTEVNRLHARVSELEAILSIQRSQIDNAAEHEQQSVREVQRDLDRVEYEVQRLKHRLIETESSLELERTKQSRQENTIAEMTALIGSKDVLIKEEKRKNVQLSNSLSELNEKNENEIVKLSAVLDSERQRNADMQNQFNKKLRELQQEAAENVPKMVATINSSLEEEYAEKLEQALNKIKMQLEGKINAMRKDQLDAEVKYAEREAQRRIAYADEKAELDSLRISLRHFQMNEFTDSKIITENRKDEKENVIPNNSSADNSQVRQVDTSLEDKVMEMLQMQLKDMKSQLNSSRSSMFLQSPVAPPRVYYASSEYSAGWSRSAAFNLISGATNTVKRSIKYDEEILDTLFSKETIQPEEDKEIYSDYLPKAGVTAREVQAPSTFIEKSGAGDSKTFSSIQDGGFYEGYWKAKYL